MVVGAKGGSETQGKRTTYIWPMTVSRTGGKLTPPRLLVKVSLAYFLKAVMSPIFPEH